MLSVADATSAVLAKIAPLARERVPLHEAVGRVLGEAIEAGRALPGVDNSAMDGYAARAADLPATLPIGAVIAAGDHGTVHRAGTASRIFTGAPMPPGADTVVISEDARREGESVELPASPVGDNVRRAGEDIALGERVFAAGHRLRSWDLAPLAALGRGTLVVGRRPRIAILATGDELVELDVVPGHGQLVASTRYALAALVRECGGEPVDLGIVRDDPQAIARALDVRHDGVITTGGVSVGDRDYLKDAIDLQFWKVAIKPGKPFALGFRDAMPIFGLPGNPVSSLVAFELFVRPALLAMQGATVTARARRTVTLAHDYRKAIGRAHYVRARVDDRLVAHAHPKQGSAMLSSLVGTNALVELAAERGDVTAGETAPALMLEIA